VRPLGPAGLTGGAVCARHGAATCRCTGRAASARADRPRRTDARRPPAHRTGAAMLRPYHATSSTRMRRVYLPHVSAVSHCCGQPPQYSCSVAFRLLGLAAVPATSTAEYTVPYSVRVLPCCRVPSAPVLGQSAAPLSARTALPGCALARARLSVALSASHRILSHVAAHSGYAAARRGAAGGDAARAAARAARRLAVSE
jgi:hypothetical protein